MTLLLTKQQSAPSRTATQVYTNRCAALLGAQAAENLALILPPLNCSFHQSAQTHEPFSR
jgi:hypothetical protein